MITISIHLSKSRAFPHRVIWVEDEDVTALALASSKRGAEEMCGWLTSAHNRPIAELLMRISKARVDPWQFQPLLDLLMVLKEESDHKGGGK